ncbi:hypothetical protein GCM10023091_40080 [Ravibacter arvi]|uniref:Right handed beta helix domain-containing protein n=1 Tax=Ravibacter arvi TaxID=2051041 RepID=A0ABP8M8W5_9BACT
MRSIQLLLFAALLTTHALAQKEAYKEIQTRLILAGDGSTIELGEGTFRMTGSLSLEGKHNLVIKGKGKGRTVLDFSGQTSGAEGLLITNGTNIVLEDFTIHNAKGDCIKTKDVKGITFRNIQAGWPGKPSSKNGSYALYPVLCEKVLIENCEAYGASDAGIYVGQSRYITVKNNRAYRNVAGIEIENSLDAEVFDNEATENTGGILVFDLPDLILKKGGNVKVYRNNIHHNNLRNFAPKGNIVAKVPDGTGVLILAASDVEITGNTILNNKSIGAGVISYFVTENPIKDTAYYPYPARIHIHNNRFAREHKRPTGKGRMGMMFRFKLKFGKDVPHVLWDGIKDEKNGGPVVCVHDNEENTFANMDVANNFRNVSRDTAAVNCDFRGER